MLGERNVVYVVIYRIRILRIFRKLRILKILKFLNILTYILIAFNTITTNITDTFSVNYAVSPYYLITSSPLFHGLLSTCLQLSSFVSVEVRRKHSYISRRDTELLPNERLNTSIDISKKNNNIKNSPRKSGELQGEKCDFKRIDYFTFIASPIFISKLRAFI